jgi:hypothetical protein
MQLRIVFPPVSAAIRSANRGTSRAASWALAWLGLLGGTGCEGLGKCDEVEARALVITGEGQALYAGQAVMNRSCAAGQCHASGAKGAERQGVPKGLDFDLQPAPVVASGGKGGVASGRVQLDAKALARLRKNQRTVFDLREDIWDQISDGLMPPDGVGAAYRQAEPGYNVVVQGSTCRRGTDALKPIAASSTKAAVRNWLACGAPVVELSHAAIAVSALTQDPAGQPGTVGQQMPFCQDCDAPITFDLLYANVLQTCVAGCHTSGGIAPPDDFEGFDLSDIDTAYVSLTKAGVTGGSEDCNAKPAPLVVPGDPAASYLVAKMGGGAETPLSVCGLSMPFAQPVLECGVRQVIKWIEEGAPEPGQAVEDASDADAGMSEADAGI